MRFMDPQPTALEIRRVRVRDGFCVLDVKIKRISITVYNAEGYSEPNQYNAYAVNNMLRNWAPAGSGARATAGPSV